MSLLEKTQNVFLIDLVGKVSTQCDSCKQSIDTSKPKASAKKGPDGKVAKPKPNPAIKATLEFPIDSGETKDYHFCDEECLRQYLNKRNKA